MADSTEVKWHFTCGKWTDHFRAGHTPEYEAPKGANLAEEGAGAGAGLGIEVLTKPGKEKEVEKDLEDNANVDDTGGMFARLRRDGLI